MAADSVLSYKPRFAN